VIEAYKKFWIKAFDFKSKSSRKDYWLVVLAGSIIGLIYSIFILMPAAFLNEGLYIFLLGISNLYFFASIIPSWAISIRRIRDAGKSWQWVFINFIPILGNIYFLILLCQPSSKDPIQKNIYSKKALSNNNFKRNANIAGSNFIQRASNDIQETIISNLNSLISFVKNKKEGYEWKKNLTSDEREFLSYSPGSNFETEESFKKRFALREKKKDLNKYYSTQKVSSVSKSDKNPNPKEQLTESQSLNIEIEDQLDSNLIILKSLFEDLLIDDKEYKILKKGALGFEDYNDESGIKKDNFSDKLEKIDKNKLVKARNLFKENLIDQEEYDLLRKEILGI